MSMMLEDSVLKTQSEHGDKVVIPIKKIFENSVYHKVFTYLLTHGAEPFLRSH
jgi:hypothetical protein